MIVLRTNLEEIARRKGYSIKSLARESGISEGTIRDYWKAHTERPDLRTLSRIADFLGVHPLELLTTEVSDENGNR